MKIDRSEEFSRVEREHIRLETGQLSEPERVRQRDGELSAVRCGLCGKWGSPDWLNYQHPEFCK